MNRLNLVNMKKFDDEILIDLNSESITFSAFV